VSRAQAIGRAATDADLAAVTACLASAFHDDPTWGHWAFPDVATRPAGLRRLMGFWAGCSARHPWLRMTDGCEAVAAWTPAGEPEMTPAEEVAFAALLPDLFGARESELEALMGQFADHHPHEPHFYLGLWGTDRAHAGRGWGTRLLRDNLAQIDALRQPAYLESTNPANLERYRGLGFADRTTFGPPGGPVVTTMWRAAR
jgi:hypothetical protein